MPTVAFFTLGCRLNQADTALAADDLCRYGFTVVPWGTPADVIVINSCAVTATASQKTRQAVRAARRRFPKAFVVLMGCEASAPKTEWSGLGAPDLLFPNPKPGPLSQFLPHDLTQGGPTVRLAAGSPTEDFLQPGVGLFTERTRANLKIQEGCNFRCSYCIVPQTRGPARSRDWQDVLREAEALLERGHRELVLTGVNVTQYASGGMDLAALMEKLLALGTGYRLRIGSAEPGAAIRRVIPLMASNPMVCRFLHLPVQYGEDRILKAMRRHYTAAAYAKLVEEAAATVPGVCIGTDVMVGFPGETDETFAQCKALLEALPLGLMHVFVYSPRPDTDAATYPQRPEHHVAERRSEELLALGRRKAEAFAQSQVGKILEVLVEGEKPSTGWSDNYLQVTIKSPKLLKINELYKSLITCAIGGRGVCGDEVHEDGKP